MKRVLLTLQHLSKGQSLLGLCRDGMLAAAILQAPSTQLALAGTMLHFPF